jgi:hypothetical protein
MSLPELPTDTTVISTGHARTVAGQTLIVLPYAAPIGPSRGRRFHVETDDTAPVFRVVFSLGGHAAMRPPGPLPLRAGESVTLRLRASTARSRQRIPADLTRALAAVGLGLDGFDEAAVRHLLSMVTEARDPHIRAARVTAAVAAAEHMRKAQ